MATLVASWLVGYLPASLASDAPQPHTYSHDVNNYVLKKKPDTVEEHVHVWGLQESTIHVDSSGPEAWRLELSCVCGSRGWFGEVL